MTRARIGALLVAAAAMIVAPGSQAESQPERGARGPTAVQARLPQADVHQLASRVRKVIRALEDHPTIPCDTRNHFVRRLRLLNDTLEAGNRSGARALVMAWSGEARSYQRAGLLSAGQGSLLHNNLQGLPEAIGTGATKQRGTTRTWKPLPACDDSGASSGSLEDMAGASVLGSEYQPFDTNDILLLIRYFAGMVPEIGPLLSSLAAALWPAGGTDVSALIDQALEEHTYTEAVATLDGLRTALSPYEGFGLHLNAWSVECAGKADTELCKSSAQNLYVLWSSVKEIFIFSRKSLQTDREDYQRILLPVFAQYETMYLSFLREGIMLAPVWIASGRVTPSEAAIPAVIMADELNPDFVNPDTGQRDRGTAYVDRVYTRELDKQPLPTNWNRWITRNGYIRDMTLKVMDFRNTWKFMDPVAYPNGFDGSVKVTRMIYTDPLGHMLDRDFDDDFKPPPNVPGPLTELTVWAQRAPYNATRGGQWLQNGSSRAISAVQFTSPPAAGPALSGPITGDTTHDGDDNRHWYRDFRVLGPVTEVLARGDRKSGFFEWIPSHIALKLATTGAWDYLAWNQNVNDSDMPRVEAAYPGHVLAAVGAMGSYSLGNGQTTDAIIFGFRFYDSFFPSGALVSVGSGKCMNVSGLTAGTQATIQFCSGGPGQIWSYNTNTKAVMIGDLCLKATGTTSGSGVRLEACTEAEDQQWELVPSTSGLSGAVTSVQSGLVLDVPGGTGAGTPITLWAANGGSSQQWTTTSPLQGEIRGVGSGRCLNVTGGGTVNGTAVQILTCNAAPAQAWTYDEGAHTLSVYNGTKCLDASSVTPPATLRIWDCSGADTQAWAFNRDGTIGLFNANDVVLDVSSGSRADGAQVIASARLADSTSQQWSRPSRRGGNVHATYAGKCLDVPNLLNGTPAQIYTCFAAPAPGQEWTYHPLTQRLTAHGDGSEHCLAATGAVSGAAVVVSECTADPNQLWILKASGVGGRIVNAASDLCLTVAGTGTVTADLARVEVQTCAAKDVFNPNQQWIWP